MAKRKSTCMGSKPIADIFDKIASLLKLNISNPFRVSAYRNAAQSIRNNSDRLEDPVDDGEKLEEIPNTVESIAKTIHEIRESGICTKQKQQLRQISRGLEATMYVPKLGPSRARLGRETTSSALRVAGVADPEPG